MNTSVTDPSVFIFDDTTWGKFDGPGVLAY